MKLTPKRVISLALLAAFILLLLIPAIRLLSQTPILAGDTPYYHLRLSKHIKENGIPMQDPLIERPYSIQPYHLLLSITNNIYFASIITPFILGLISIILFYLILKQLKIDLLRISTIMLTLILSPLFIFLFSTSTHYALIIPLILLGFLFFTKEKHFFIPSLIIFAAMPFFGILPSIIAISLLLIYSINNRSKLKYFYTILGAIIPILLAYQLPFLYYYGFPHKTKLIHSTILTNLVSDLGSNMGFGIFNIILAFVGLFLIWKNKKQITGYILLLSLVILSFYIPQINIYLLFLVSIFAGFGFARIIEMKWKIDLIKKLTIILIICGLLFSTLSYINRLSNELPNKEIIQSLEWLEENSPTNAVVFSHYSKGLWIEEFSQRQPLLDSEIYHIKSLNTKFNDSNTTFYSRNLKTTKSILDKYNIRYIWIDPKMKQGQVWTREQEGLLFLFRNSETFKKLYSKDDIEIWEYKG